MVEDTTIAHDAVLLPAGLHLVEFISPVHTHLAFPVLRDDAAVDEFSHRVTEVVPAETAVSVPRTLFGGSVAWGGLRWFESGVIPRRRPALEISGSGEAFDVDFEALKGIDRTLGNWTFRLHELGVAVLSVTVQIRTTHPIRAEDFRAVAESTGEGDLVAAAERLVSMICAALSGPLDRIPFQSSRFAENAIVAFHRVYFLDAPMPGTTEARERAMLEISRVTEAENSYAGGTHFAFVGNGATVFAGNDATPASDSSPATVVRLYQFYYLAILLLDELLSDAIRQGMAESSDSRAAVTTQRQVEQFGDLAKTFRFSHIDDLSTLPAQHLVYWRQMEAQWQTPSIEASLAEKAEHLGDIANRIHSRIAARVARRTSLVVTAFTCLTVVTLLVDSISFSTGSGVSVDPSRLAIVFAGLAAAAFAFVMIRRSAYDDTTRHQ